MMNIYITNLRKYNEGELVGEWVKLPISEDELDDVLNRIGINEEYEEYFISDYDVNFNYCIDEYENIYELNEIAKTLEDVNIDVIDACLSYGYDINDSIEIYEDGDYMIYHDVNDMSDVAYQYIEESGLLNNVSETIARYFDYNALGRDMVFEGMYYFTDNGDCIEILR